MDDWTVARPFVQNAQADQADNDVAEAASASATMSEAGLTPVPVSRLGAWVRLIRPSALLLVLVPALTALALLWLRGVTVLALPALAGIASLALVQAGASLLDVYLECARRAHLPETERRDHLTARALLARSAINPLNVLRLSILLIVFGALAGIPLVISGGWPVALLGLAGVAIAFLFSATSFALKRFPLADFVIGLALGPGIVAGMMLAQRHAPTGRDLLFAGALGFLAMLPAAGAHLRDAQQDALLGRKTLVTVLGDGLGRTIYLVWLLAAMALLVLAALPHGAPHGALLGFLALPSFSIPVSGALVAKPGYARAQVVLQERRAYALFAFWFLFGLAINAILISGLGPIPATV
ncbi:MAG TPA: prenyltransferase [Ktedonobacterales bacterium]|jgi:1,4-dihydroxy-2-naphthoate polyprenyltransferase|nr:prenyltransferase [Ktedonobacterales bacterium]